MIRTSSLLWTAALALGLSACGADELNVEPNFASIRSEVFEQTCLDGGCHNSADADTAGGLDLESGAFDNLVNVPAEQPAAAADELNRVEPGSAFDSVLYLKLSGTEYGTRMPQGQRPLPDDVLAAIKQWIDDGAPR